MVEEVVVEVVEGDSALLLVQVWTVLELCLTAGVQDRGTQTVLSMVCAGKY